MEPPSDSELPKEKIAKGKHGGSRRVLCWEEKLQCLDRNAIVNFIATVTCGCKRDCGEKIRNLEESEAVAILNSLRSARLQGGS